MYLRALLANLGNEASYLTNCQTNLVVVPSRTVVIVLVF